MSERNGRRECGCPRVVEADEIITLRRAYDDFATFLESYVQASFTPTPWQEWLMQETEDAEAIEGEAAMLGREVLV